MSVHPLEQLRYIARQWDNGDDFPAQEIAAVLAELADENPASLLQACRRLIEYYPSTGAAWWLSSRALSAAGAVEGIWEAAEELSSDPTARTVRPGPPQGRQGGFPRAAAALVRALRRRNDLEVSHRTSQARPTCSFCAPGLPARPGLLFARSTSGPLASAAQTGVPVWAVHRAGHAPARRTLAATSRAGAQRWRGGRGGKRRRSGGRRERARAGGARSCSLQGHVRARSRAAWVEDLNHAGLGIRHRG